MSQKYFFDDVSNSFLNAGNAAYIEALYQSYLENSESVPLHWQEQFGQLLTQKDDISSPQVSVTQKSPLCVENLINAYRSNGVLKANLDPLKLNMLGVNQVDEMSELTPEYYGWGAKDMQTQVDTSGTYFSRDQMTLQELLSALKSVYCGTLGVEYMYIRDSRIRNWWAERLESTYNQPQKLGNEKKKHLLERLTAAESLETYLSTKYVGVKRFSLEGGESFIVALDELIGYSASKGVDEIVVGMAHRGRLNALVNTLGKPPFELFSWFEGKVPEILSSGDVSYHQGYSNNLKTPYGTVHVSIGYNPSHLETVSAVQSGSARARMERCDDVPGDTVLAVTVHGDGAIVGQGIVQEIFNLAGTRGYYVGGSIRIVINNQVQFTTSDLRDARTSLFCTDIARMIDMPVLHVNGDDPEALIFAIQLAVDFRQKFHRDVMLDLVGFRKLGHNEQDTPQITQPFMYKAIKEHPGARRVYAQTLIDEGVIDVDREKGLISDYHKALENNRIVSMPVDESYQYPYANNWEKYLDKPWVPPIATGLPLKELKQLAKAIATVPKEINVHPLVQRVLTSRLSMGKEEIPVDWGMAENLAYASLVKIGVPVRLSGEDCARGTFSHRQCMVHDQNRKYRTEDPYVPLQHIAKKQASFSAIDSTLSENAVMGFEYGYSTSCPHGLTLWEAQFGDFANGGQVVIDQFLSSGECKWGQRSGLVLLLPHGLEGQGPEHSSARIERFLKLSAEDNWVLAQPTNATQIFHLLRLQALAPYRKPLVVFSPKSLLRHKNASVPLKMLSTGAFQMVIPDTGEKVKERESRRVILCSGKIYYDLLARREAFGAFDVALLRVEQLYPFPSDVLSAELKKYEKAKEVIWCQDEPENQGAWGFAEPLLRAMLPASKTLSVLSRPPSPAPATGYAHKYHEQQEALMVAAFASPSKIEKRR